MDLILFIIAAVSGLGLLIIHGFNLKPELKRTAIFIICIAYGLSLTFLLYRWVSDKGVTIKECGLISMTTCIILLSIGHNGIRRKNKDH